jgi:rhodanese-related sulfurtransferase
MALNDATKENPVTTLHSSTQPNKMTLPTAAPRANGGPAVATSMVEEATPRQVQEWLRSGEAVLIDVREPDEHARERITGARLLPLSRFDPREAAALVKPGQRLVLHCRGGSRSADAARRAIPLAAQTGTGVTVVSMTGGLEAWKKETLPTELNTSVSGISIMRQVQLVVGTAVLAGSALAWFVHPALVAIPAFFGAGLTFAGASGTCALATVLGMMPWNKRAATTASCSTGQCG